MGALDGMITATVDVDVFVVAGAGTAVLGVSIELPRPVLPTALLLTSAPEFPNSVFFTDFADDPFDCLILMSLDW